MNEVRAKQRILNWGILNVLEVLKEMFNIPSNQGNENQNDPKIPPSHAEWLSSKSQVAADAGKDVVKEEHSSIDGGNETWQNHFGCQSGSFWEFWK